MHVCLLTAIEGSPLDGEDPVAEAARLASLLGSMEAHPHAPFSIHVTTHVLAWVAEARPELAGRLPDLAADWVRTGWGRPDPSAIPESLLATALLLETEQLQHLGLAPGPMWIREGWSERLLPTLAEAGVGALLLDLPRGPDRRTGVVAHLDRVVPAFRVEDGLGDLEAGDDCLVARVEPEHLRAAIDRLAATPGCDLTTVSSFLESHRAVGRLRVPSPEPEPPGPDPLHRKLVRLATRLPERAAPAAVQQVLAAASAAALAPGADPETQRRAHLALIRARAVAEGDRRSGEAWGRVSRVDWDADGVEEVEVEQPGLSVVVDPEHGGEVVLLDDKVEPWAAAFLPGAPPGRLLLVEGGEGHPLEIERTEEAKGEVRVGLVDPDRTLVLTLLARDRALTIRYEIDGAAAGRLGPRLPLALGETRVRVDGSDWLDLAEPVALAGHRFRLEGETRQVLLTSMVPAEVEIVPHPGGVSLAARWTTDGTGTYELAIDLAP